MKNIRPFLSLLTLAVVSSLALSCGANSDPNSDPSSGRQLMSVTLNPATADAQDYPDGQVQFTATGYYNSAPYTVVPLSAGWGECYQEMSTSAITVSSTGLAQCVSGALGTYTVWANSARFPEGANCNAITACGGGCFVAGTAQLTCP
jgi:hypothetical protein